MVGRKKRTQNCDKVSHEEDRISQLPEPLISEILCHLSTKDAVRTSVLSTKWRYLWKWVPGLDVEFNTFPNNDLFVSFLERFFVSCKESWIRKLRLNICDPYRKCDLNSWIDFVTTTPRLRHLAVSYCPTNEIPLSIYKCKTLVHLALVRVALADAEIAVSFPCLKIMHLEDVVYPNETMLQKLISGSPVLEDLMISTYMSRKAKVLQVLSHTLKRMNIDESTEFVIDAPLLQSLRTTIHLTKNFKIINVGFPTKLDIDVVYGNLTYGKSLIHDILTDISRVRDLVITNVILKEIFSNSNSGPVLQFRDLSSLNAKLCKSDLEMLPTILESCPKLESFTLELVKDPSMIKKEPNVVFSAVPQCLVSSLKFVELKRLTPRLRYEGEMELIRYFLKNSKVLKKLKLNVYYTKKAKCDFLTEVVALTRCSSACEVLVL
ncbi:F-box/FBD/LRR-repeat protein At1g51370 [Capsella rubella]|uniref:F-box/FBD/LRR-repeat protein At1g51370 n=1 Tax=Capsella rubella TaxID=81985 RepID=UPI000CD51DCB|nr:F-box/FBD/LRR-repeat protein At1g51370 [Capsella rubella]